TVDSGLSIEGLFGTKITTFKLGQGDIQINPSLERYVYGSTVQLMAVPNDGYYLKNWAQAVTGDVSPMEYKVEAANPTVMAFFVPATGKATLTLLVDGPGKVEVEPQKAVYSVGETVALNAVPNSSAKFVGYSGGVEETQSSITLTLDENKTVTATFEGDWDDQGETGTTIEWTQLEYLLDGNLNEKGSQASALSGENHAFVTGKDSVGKGVEFNGQETSVRIPKDVFSGLDQATVVLWVKLDEPVKRDAPYEWQTLFRLEGDTVGNSSVMVGAGALRIFVTEYEADSGEKDYVPASGKWLQVALQLAEDKMRVFVDGEFVRGGKLNTPASLGTYAVVLGRFGVGNGNYALDGLLDGVTIYAEALSESKLKELYEAGKSESGGTVEPEPSVG
ncbi:MAG TPA: LamG domain-containing protein, partial [Myxococcales bacterium]|nr:LamG domain-containing protein [Myxococcales bacterium]